MCIDPRHLFQIGWTEKGKPDYLRCSGNVVAVEKYGSQWIKHQRLSDIYRPSNVIKEFIEAPCQQCMECRLNYSTNWANRMMLEAQYHESNFFLTLTYDDEYCPVNQGVWDPDSDSLCEPVFTLQKEDVQNFIKRLRARLEYAGRPSFRYYLCGEYGSRTFRPHYHIVCFGLELEDLEFLKTSKLGFPYYRSKLIEECWTAGYSMVCNVSWETCAYVARYVTKKWKGIDKSFYYQENMLPEFTLMSRKPGIARQYYDEHKDEIYQFDEFAIPTDKGGKMAKPPRYYDQLYDLEAPDLMAAIKERRQRSAEMIEEVRKRNTTLSKEEQLKARADLMAKRLEMLKREDI